MANKVRALAASPRAQRQQRDAGRDQRRLGNLRSDAAETMGAFRLLREMGAALDREALGAIVLSMTRSAADVLGAYLLAKYAGLFIDAEGIEACKYRIAPLFETIADLQSAPAIMREFLSIPLVRRTIREHGGSQEVMIGYSDSNKGGGFLGANWELTKAQIKLTRVGEAMQTRPEEPFAYLCGGETTVTIRGGGRGGRNQEMTLAFAIAAERQGLPERWVFLSGGTDGRDGPSDAAGGMVDPWSLGRMRAASLDPVELLNDNDSYRALDASGVILRTGATGTNVADLQIVLVN